MSLFPIQGPVRKPDQNRKFKKFTMNMNRKHRYKKKSSEVHLSVPAQNEVQKRLPKGIVQPVNIAEYKEKDSEI